MLCKADLPGGLARNAVMAKCFYLLLSGMAAAEMAAWSSACKLWDCCSWPLDALRPRLACFVAAAWMHGRHQ